MRYEVSSDAGNRALLQRRAAELGVDVRGVPMTFFGTHHWVGFDQRVAEDISATVARTARSAASSSDHPAVIAVPLVGEVDPGGSSLLVSTLLIGALDGLNPCSLWVLSLLLAMVLHTGSRRRVLAVGTTFLAVTAGLYALYVGGVYSLLSYVSYVGWIRVALALVAGVFGALAIRDFIASGRGFTLAIPARHKPGIYRRARQVAVADRPLATVLGGTALLAAGVSLVETPCTAGFPMVWSSLLASQHVGGLGAVGLFTCTCSCSSSTRWRSSRSPWSPCGRPGCRNATAACSSSSAGWSCSHSPEPCSWRPRCSRASPGHWPSSSPPRC